MKKQVHVEKAHYEASERMLYLFCNDVSSDGKIEFITRVHPGGEQRYYREVKIPDSCFTCSEEKDFFEEMQKTAPMFEGKKIFVETGSPDESDSAIKLKLEIDDKYKD